MLLHSLTASGRFRAARCPPATSVGLGLGVKYHPCSWCREARVSLEPCVARAACPGDVAVDTEVGAYPFTVLACGFPAHATAGVCTSSGLRSQGVQGTGRGQTACPLSVPVLISLPDFPSWTLRSPTAGGTGRARLPHPCPGAEETGKDSHVCPQGEQWQVMGRKWRSDSTNRKKCH